MLRYFAVLLLAAGSAFAAYSNGYTNRRSITIDHTKVVSTLSSYPLKVRGAYSYLAATGSGGKVTHASGYDILFTASDGTTNLDFERALWVPTTGEVEFDVLVSSASSTVDTVVYIYYGNASQSTDPQNATAVWSSNYKGVWHLADGTTLGLGDSTSNAHTLTNNGTVTAGAGQNDGGGVYGGVAYLSAGTSADFDASTGMTCEGWFKLDASGWNDPDAALCGKADASLTNGWSLWVQNTGTILFFVAGGTHGGSSSLSLGAWHYVAVTWDGTTYKVFFDGNSSPSISYASAVAPVSSGQPLFIGASATNRRIKGTVDEIRYSNTALPVAWLSTQYANHNDPATFYALGAETTSGAAAGAQIKRRIEL